MSLSLEQFKDFMTVHGIYVDNDLSSEQMAVITDFWGSNREPDTDDPAILYYLSKYYETVTPSTTDYIKYFKRSESQNYPLALLETATVTSDPEKIASLQHFLKALTESRNPAVLVKLGDFYSDIDVDLAISCYLRAAEQDTDFEANAFGHLARIYHDIHPDIVKFESYCRQGMERGDTTCYRYWARDHPEDAQYCYLQAIKGGDTGVINDFINSVPEITSPEAPNLSTKNIMTKLNIYCRYLRFNPDWRCRPNSLYRDFHQSLLAGYDGCLKVITRSIAAGNCRAARRLAVHYYYYEADRSQAEIYLRTASWLGDSWSLLKLLKSYDINVQDPEFYHSCLFRISPNLTMINSILRHSFDVNFAWRYRNSLTKSNLTLLNQAIKVALDQELKTVDDTLYNLTTADSLAGITLTILSRQTEVEGNQKLAEIATLVPRRCRVILKMGSG